MDNMRQKVIHGLSASAPENGGLELFDDVVRSNHYIDLYYFLSIKQPVVS